MSDFENPFAGLNKNDITIKQEKSMSENKTGITTTIKFGASFDAPWSVLHTADLNEANGILESPEFGRYAQNVVTYAKAAQGLYGPVAPAKPAARPAPAAGDALAGLGGGGGGEAQGDVTCAHGPRKAPFSKGNWTAMFCGGRGLDKSQECPPAFLNKKTNRFELKSN
ncbi:hypothetical protein [Streptomyces sp. NPDC059708]|uniref:hypothetical protein n=1 Tax=Streptomyces sp. NPDC059708 TaxID=3346916 RepID=UPI0036BA55A8